MVSLVVLHVGNDAGSSQAFSKQLTNASHRCSVISKQSFDEAREYLETGQHSVECIVSACDCQEQDCLAFLRTVRADYPNLPFIILANEENESMASEAISAGATDYHRRDESEDTYELLANRIEGFVDQYRSQQERDRVYQALETATEGIGLIDDDGEYIYLNETYAELYGYDRDELIGEHWERLYPDDEAARFHEDILPQLHEEGSWSGQSSGQRVTGETFPEELALTQLASGGHVCVVRDVSKQVERQRQFETLADNLQGMVYRAENAAEWAVEFAHGNIEELLGYTISDLYAHRINWAEIIHPDDREQVWDVVQQAVQASERFEITYRVIDAEGETKWVTDRGHGVTDDSGTVKAIDGLITDVTDRKQYEQELEWKTKAMDEAPVGTVISDPSQDDNPLIYGNNKFTELTGYSEEEILGRNCRFLQGPLTDEESTQEIRAGIDNRETVEVDLLNYRKDKTPFWNHLQISPITDTDGELTHFVGFQNNATSRVEHKRRIEILHRVLLHNIRNDLNLVLGTLDTLRDRPDVTDETVDAVREPTVNLLESSEKARKIESWLKDISFSPEKLNIERVLDTAVTHGKTIDEDADVQMTVESERDVIASESIVIAFGELVENAITHAIETPPSVTITTETDTVTFPHESTAADTVVVHIEDTNTEISELDRTRLLGNEESAVNHGSGLGMWLINWLVTMSGGLIEHTTRDGGGNRISITLLQPTG